jgi:hypothetical protein
MTKMSRRIVVDASVARSAGTTENPVSILCRNFLHEMLQVCHRVVITSDIEKEWRKHRSRFSIAWLAAMESRNRVVRVQSDTRLEEQIHVAVDRLDGLTRQQEEAIRKDILLVTAASVTDKLIASRDDRMRILLKLLSAELSEVGSVLWVNPSNPDEDPCKWLEAGARYESHRRLDRFET